MLAGGLQEACIPPKAYALVLVLAAYPAINLEHLTVTERVALITGASAGIGTELARGFASNGHRLALVARRADRLVKLAREIAAAGGAAPIVIACDLEQPDAGDKIAAVLAAEGVEVEYVLNNAGYGFFCTAVQLHPPEQPRPVAPHHPPPRP